MKHVGWDKAIITGLSMVCFLHLYIGFDLIIDFWQGGGIAAGFATKYPEMVDEKMILLCPTGLLKVGSDSYGVYSIDW